MPTARTPTSATTQRPRTTRPRISASARSVDTHPFQCCSLLHIVHFLSTYYSMKTHDFFSSIPARTRRGLGPPDQDRPITTGQMRGPSRGIRHNRSPTRLTMDFWPRTLVHCKLRVLSSVFSFLRFRRPHRTPSPTETASKTASTRTNSSCWLCKRRSIPHSHTSDPESHEAWICGHAIRRSHKEAY